MSGYPITNIRDYNKYFNIYDVLKYHKEFLTFILSHFANLSKAFTYCAAMVYTTVKNQIPLHMCDDIWDNRSDVNFDKCNPENFWNNPFSFCQDYSPSSELLNIFNEVAMQFKNKTDDIVFKKVMIISIAAFTFLNDKNIDTKIDLEKAKISFLGNEDKKTNNLYEIRFDDDMSECIQTIKLEPSSEFYTCELFIEGDFKEIKTFRIEASRKINSLSNRTVKINVGDKQIIIPTGEHIYVNTINGQIATILEKNKLKKGHKLQNAGVEKDVLKFDDENNAVLDFYGNEYISSFDFSPSDDSIVYINNLRLCLNMCSSPILMEQLTKYSDLNLVEVKLVNSRFYLLRSNGELLSNDPKCNGEKNVYSIESVLRRFQ